MKNKDEEYATILRGKVCTQYREHIEGMQYFKVNWITGSTNYRSSTATDRAEGIHIKKRCNVVTNQM